ncbi:MAG: insulinase family protein, partial [Candidatus Eremiobacteraeota bacterium]|nr:insulinase family protein [Candidatus Eremiobacteraeota bacterium]
MMRTLRLVSALVLFALSSVTLASAASESPLAVTRATLPNGLRVIVVRNPLAPVVTLMLNYEAGSDEQQIDGQAHALEHMMFRGSNTVSSSQLMDSVSITGGAFDADTQNAVTQYVFTVPSQYLDIALQLERSRATGLTLAQSQWEQERGAITQEVTQDNSNALYRLFSKMQQRMLAGTPYAKNGLGTVQSFAKQISATNLKQFYSMWYHPNNAVYVIVGDVDGPATIAKVRALFGDWNFSKLPAKPPVTLRSITAKTFRDTSDLPVTVALLGYRLPGYDSPDFAAANIVADVLSSQRGDLFALAAEGKALETTFQLNSFRKTSLGVMLGVVPVAVKPEAIDAEMRAVVDQYRKNGMPADLVEASKRREISQLKFNGNSIEGLAGEWSQAVAVQGLQSPDDMIAEYERVTTADVDRVLRTYIDNARVVTAYAVPKNSGAVSSGSGSLAKENVMVPPKKHDPLPAFANHVLANLKVPEKTLSPTSMMLANGIRLIVQPESITKTVVVSGTIDNNTSVQEPPALRGINDVTTALFPYGTTTYDRLAYQTELDKIAAAVTAGTEFGVSSLSKDFDRAVQLLADNELHPAFDAKSFEIVKTQEVGALQGEVKSPDYLSSVALANALYPPGDPYRTFPTPATAAAIKLDDVKAWYRDAYRPDLTTIVVIG